MNLTAVCVRSDGWWAITIPELEHVYSQARRLDQVEKMVREAAALHTELDPASFTITVQPQLDQETEAFIQTAVDKKTAATQAATFASKASREAACRLMARGFTMRDIGMLLGVSYQRAQKLVSEGAAKAA